MALEEGNSVSETLPEVDQVLEVQLGVGRFQPESLQEPRAWLRLDLTQSCHHLI